MSFDILVVQIYKVSKKFHTTASYVQYDKRGTTHTGSIMQIIQMSETRIPVKRKQSYLPFATPPRFAASAHGEGVRVFLFV